MVPPRVFISYAHDDAVHEQAVFLFGSFLRSNGIDARLDTYAAQYPQDWPLWMEKQITEADFTLLIASPQYKRRAGVDAVPSEGRGAQWEAKLIRDEFYKDQEAARQRFLPVVLPGRCADELPTWVATASQSYFSVRELTVSGAEKLLRYLTRQTVPLPPLGSLPVFGMDESCLSTSSQSTWVPPRSALGSVVSVSFLPKSGGGLRVRTEVDGTLSGEIDWVMPNGIARVLADSDGLAFTLAQEQLRTGGHALACALFDKPTRN
ncbi:MAG: TIR domain-containing protein, partial [Propionibacteriaceae bacterium]|nr:TIR domain-containing protein [Propionibacteriaceae bacterium]